MNIYTHLHVKEGHYGISNQYPLINASLLQYFLLGCYQLLWRTFFFLPEVTGNIFVTLILKDQTVSRNSSDGIVNVQKGYITQEHEFEPLKVKDISSRFPWTSCSVSMISSAYRVKNNWVSHLHSVRRLRMSEPLPPISQISLRCFSHLRR
jgi:hypothetical protein